ncbi:MAG: lamin tail domain-containing protein [Deltaproteobacteria bacterium]|nr:lamin tail domain-containing protein [Deltaproteobacteria bacterium]MDQ3295412.1 lamin tail domain-containing protein [Myxococcota bacterium]
MRGLVTLGASLVLPMALALVLPSCGPSDDEGGCKDNLRPGDLVITEVFADYAAPTGGTGADEGKEWFEVYNASDRPIELEGVKISHGRPDGSTRPKEHVVAFATIAPGQYLTLGNSTKDLLPAYVDYGFSADLGDFFNTDGGRLELRCGTSLIDAADYQNVRSGRSRELTAGQPPDYTLNDEQANWCEAKDTEFETNNFGTPGQESDCRPIVIGQCTDGNGSRAAVPPSVGQLVITEVMPGPGAVGATVGEWFEAKATAEFDLNGVGLDRAGDTTVNPDIITSPDCIHVTAGSYVVFAKSADSTMNNLPAGSVKGTFRFTLVAGSVASPGDVKIVHDGTVIDAITWTKSTAAKALQLDPDLVDPVSNDSPSNFCDATTPYGAMYGSPARQDLGTPGGENTQCNLLPPAGMCDAGGTLRPIVKPAAGQLVITEFLANPAGTTDTVREWVEIKNTGATPFDLNGLTIGRASGTGTPFNSGACVSVAGGAFGLWARSADPAMNGMLPAPDATYAIALVDSNGDIEIRDGATVLDATAWTTGIASGLTRQLDPDSTTAGMNDNASAAPWCPGTTAYGDNTNKGTPKAANVQCP